MLPNVIIIGAQKAGTSSLHYYMNLHPQIFMSKHKELNFFNKGLAGKKGLGWYESNFQTDKPAKVFGEASPYYTHFPMEQGVAGRMHEIIPDAKLIYIVRDPIDRMVSQYVDRVRPGIETRPVEEVFSDDFQNSRYVYFSKYYMQIEQYLKYYDSKNILILLTEDLKYRRLETMREVFQFVGVDENFSCKEFSTLINASKDKVVVKKSNWFIELLKTDKGSALWFKERVLPMLPYKIKKKINSTLAPGKKISKPILSDELRSKIISILRDDFNKFKEFSGLEFSGWPF